MRAMMLYHIKCKNKAFLGSKVKYIIGSTESDAIDRASDLWCPRGQQRLDVDTIKCLGIISV